MKNLMAYIFVGGSQRSGTTLLQKILCSSAESNPYIAEASYLRGLLSVYKLGLNKFEEQTGYYFDTPEALKNYHTGIIQNFLTYLKKRFEPATHLILKEPHMTQSFPYLFEMVPESKFVVMVRDPRDVVVSMLKIGERLRQRGGFHPLFRPEKMPEMARQIMAFYAPVLHYYQVSEAFRRRCRYLKYEVLVQEPEQSVELLRSFTGLSLSEFNPDVPPNLSSESPEEHQKHFSWGTELNEQVVSAQNVGRFRDVLLPEQIARIEAETQELMQAFGYH